MPTRDIYNASRIQHARRAFGTYATRLYVSRAVKKPDQTVDVTYVVTEGAPSFVRRVNIEGNRSTRERVIRREMGIHEGDLFKRSGLINTREDIMRLGIFEDVMPDINPAEHHIDVVIKVKEKQVGTASAARVTPASRGDRFLFVAQQRARQRPSLALHRERSGRVRTIHSASPSRGSAARALARHFRVRHPQLRDYYSEQRTGGSVRLGQPRPGSATRAARSRTGSERHDRRLVADHQDNLALAGQSIRSRAHEQRQGSLNHNTTDNRSIPRRAPGSTSTTSGRAGHLAVGRVPQAPLRRAHVPALDLEAFHDHAARPVGLLGNYSHGQPPTTSGSGSAVAARSTPCAATTTTRSCRPSSQDTYANVIVG